jgi:hypothetical protein
VLGGPLDGTPLIFDIRYDETFLSGIGDESLFPDFGALEVLVDGEPGFEQLDVGYPDFPELLFVDGVPTILDFIIDLTDTIFAGLGFDAILIGLDHETFDYFPLVYDPDTDVYMTFTTLAPTPAPIPLPAGLPLLALGLGLIVVVARRRRAA